MLVKASQSYLLFLAVMCVESISISSPVCLSLCVFLHLTQPFHFLPSERQLDGMT